MIEYFTNQADGNCKFLTGKYIAECEFIRQVSLYFADDRDLLTTAYVQQGIVKGYWTVKIKKNNEGFMFKLFSGTHDMPRPQ